MGTEAMELMQTAKPERDKYSSRYSRIGIARLGNVNFPDREKRVPYGDFDPYSAISPYNNLDVRRTHRHYIHTQPRVSRNLVDWFSRKSLCPWTLAGIYSQDRESSPFSKKIELRQDGLSEFPPPPTSSHISAYISKQCIITSR